jgi:glycosyltransferase involved in cell wall biosynthesis
MSAFETTLPRLSAGVTTTSRAIYMRAINSKVKSSKLHLIPNGANIDGILPTSKVEARSRLGLPQRGALLVSLAQRLSYYHSETLMRVFANVLLRFPDARLLLVGRIMWTSAALEYYNQLKDRIIILGVRPYDGVSDILGASDILLLPMDDSPGDAARVPIRLGDYLAAGRPIISNAVGEVKRVLADERCGLTSPVGDPISMSERVLELLNSPPLMQEYGARARTVAERVYSWKRIASQLAGIYESLRD